MAPVGSQGALDPKAHPETGGPLVKMGSLVMWGPQGTSDPQDLMETLGPEDRMEPPDRLGTRVFQGTKDLLGILELLELMVNQVPRVPPGRLDLLAQ